MALLLYLQPAVLLFSSPHVSDSKRLTTAFPPYVMAALFQYWRQYYVVIFGRLLVAFSKDDSVVVQRTVVRRGVVRRGVVPRAVVPRI